MSESYIWVLPSKLIHKPGSFRDYYSTVYSLLQFPVDRFGFLKDIDPDTVPTVNIVPEAVYNLSNLTNDWQDRWYDLCDQAADDIYRTAGSRKIVVFYSGGIDSTCALVALMRHPDYEQWRQANRIVIALTNHSILEYPDFFYKTILPTLPIVPADFNKLIADPDNFVVTGDGGDYIIGNTDAPIFEHEGSTDNLFKSKNILYPYIDSIEPTGKFSHLLRELDKRAPFEIVSFNQLYWWLGQCFTNQGEMCYPFAWSSISDLSELASFNKMYRFFLHPRFMTYGFEHMSTNPEYHSLETLRTFSKEYIINYTGHRYYIKKNKIMSQRTLVRKWFKSTIYSDLTWDNNKSKVAI